MKPGLRLALNMAAWTVAIPALGIVGSLLGKTVFRSAEAEVVMAHAMEVLLVVWAALIYWRCVPSASSLPRRAIYLVLFAATMAMLGYFALGAAIMVVIMLFGL